MSPLYLQQQHQQHHHHHHHQQQQQRTLATLMPTDNVLLKATFFTDA
jgi:hypothetical protein